MSEPNVVPILPVDVEIFCWIHETFNLLVALEEDLGTITIHQIVIDPQSP